MTMRIFDWLKRKSKKPEAEPYAALGDDIAALNERLREDTEQLVKRVDEARRKP
jgi:hypothetical protein